MAQVNGMRRDGAGEGGLEFRAMDGDAGAVAGGKRDSFDAFAEFVFHQHAAEGAAGDGEAGENFQVDLLERTDGVGPKAHAGADFF